MRKKTNNKATTLLQMKILRFSELKKPRSYAAKKFVVFFVREI